MPKHLVTDEMWEKSINILPELVFYSDMSEKKKKIALTANAYLNTFLYEKIVREDKANGKSGEQSDEINCIAVESSSKNFKYIVNPSYRVILHAAKHGTDFGDIEKYIKGEMSEELQLAFVEKDGSKIRYIPNPTRRVCILAVNDNAAFYKYIPEEYKKEKAFQYLMILNEYGFRETHDLKEFALDEETQLLAVAKSGMAGSIRNFWNPSEKVQFLSVWIDYDELQYIENQSEIIQLAGLVVLKSKLNSNRLKRVVSFINKPHEETLKYSTIFENIRFKHMGTKRDSIIYNFKNLSPEIKQQYYSDIENKLKQMHGKIMAEVQVIEKHAQAIVAELLQEARTPTEIDNV